MKLCQTLGIDTTNDVKMKRNTSDRYFIPIESNVFCALRNLVTIRVSC